MAGQDLAEVREVDALLDKVFAESREQHLEDVKVVNAQSKQPTPMTEQELAAVIHAEMGQSYGEENSELSADRARALDYYFNRPRGDEKRGNSQVQSSDVMDVIEWVLPDIIEAFTTNDEAVLFEAIDEDDEKNAILETRYVNKVFYDEAGGYLTLHDFFKDALLQKNGIVRVYWDDSKRTRYAEYTNLTSVELQQVMEGDEDTEVEVYEQNTNETPLSEVPEELHQQLMMLPEVQEQIQSIHQQAREIQLSEGNETAQQFVIEETQKITIPSYDVKVKMFITGGHVVAEPIPPEEFNINEDHASVDVSGARFTCHEARVTETDLIEQGFDPDIVRNLPSDSFPTDEEDFARQYHTLNREYGSTMDNTMRLIRTRYCTMKVDFDGDGVAELRNVVEAGYTILENEYADTVPFTCISPIMVPHRWVGVSFFDRAKQIQDIATAIWRQLLDNMYKANNQRTIAVENQVNLDDLLSSRPGGVVRVKSLESLMPFPHTPIGAESFQLLERLNQVRMERTGVGPEMMAQGMVIDNETAHGVERLMSAKEKLVGVVIRNFGETGVKDIFIKIRDLLIKHQNKAKQQRINGEWVSINPQEWRWRSSVTVKVGLGAGDKMRHASTLGTIIARQDKLMDMGMGGILVDDDKIFNAHSDFARYSGLRNPTSYFLDPKTPAAMQTKKAKQEEAKKPKLEDKILILESQIEQMDAKLRAQKQKQDMMIKQNEQQRKWADDRDTSAREWTELEIAADKDLGPEGRAE